MRLIIALIAVVVTLSIAAAAFVYSGAYNVGADEEHWGATADMLRIARVRSVERRAKDVVPPKLDDPQVVRSGAVHYDEMCAMCHLAPGLEDTELRRGLYPKPADLTKSNVRPAAAFWVIKHGIKMSAMPAWGTSHDDETIWSIVALVQQLPSLNPGEYKAILAQPQTSGIASVKAPSPGPEPHEHSHGTRAHSHAKVKAR